MTARIVGYFAKRPRRALLRRLLPILRIVAYSLAILVTGAVLGGCVEFILPKLSLPSWLSNLLGIYGFTYLVVVLLATWLVCRFVNRRPLQTLGLSIHRRCGVLAATGAALGIVLVALIFGVHWVMGWLQFESFAWSILPSSSLIAGLVVITAHYAIVGFNEELIMRGYVQQNLIEEWGVRPGVLVSALLFGLIHLSNEGATFLSILNMVALGLLFSYGYLITRSLWLPAALHFTWNLTQSVLGFPVSGASGFHLCKLHVRGPVLLSGGSFGPEGGLLVTVATALGFALLFAWNRVQSKQVPARGGKQNE